MTLDEAHAAQAEKFTALKAAVAEFFDAQLLYQDLVHDEECTDPDCEETRDRSSFSGYSISTFVVAAEMTSVSLTDERTVTRTSRCNFGSPMSVLGLLTESSWRIGGN